MKTVLFVLLMVLMIVTSCNRKLQSSASQPTLNAPVANTNHINDTKILAPVLVEPAPAAKVLVKLEKPLIVIDETGTIITARNKLPAAVADKVDYPSISRSYTPAQRQHLIYRFKMVPPRVLYVPDHLVSKTARGYYCVYRKRFWYWKKEDGLFHLDGTYYQ